MSPAGRPFRLVVYFLSNVMIESCVDQCKNITPNVGLEPTTLRLRVSCSTD